MFTGLYTSNPNTDPNAKRIEVVENINELDVDVGGAGSSVGTGGMVTKLLAAEIAAEGGVDTVIASGRREKVLLELADGKKLGTRFSLQKKYGPSVGTQRVEIFAFLKTGKMIVEDGEEMEEIKQVVPARYNTKSELTVTIQEGKNLLAPFELLAEKK